MHVEKTVRVEIKNSYQPTYSPDLTHANNHFFEHLKKIPGKWFHSYKAVENTFHKFVS